MPDFAKLIEMLQSSTPSRRYDACEELRVASHLPYEAMDALRKATEDPDPSVAEVAKNALAAHTPPAAPAQSAPPPSIPPSVATAPPSMPSSPPTSPEYVFALERRVMFLETEMRRMSDSIARAAEASAAATSKLPSTAIVSPSFLTRAFAVWGHYFVAQVIIAVPIYCIIFLVAMGGGSGY